MDGELSWPASAPPLASAALPALAIERWLQLPAGPAGTPYEIDTSCLPWGDHAVLLAEFAHSRELGFEALCADAGLRAGQALLSPRQLLALLEGLRREGGADTPFVLGRQLLPGHYGLASQTLAQAADLREALRQLCRWSGRLSPLLTPRLLVDEQTLTLVWADACGLPPSLRGFVVDLHMSAVTHGCAALAGMALPWQYCFNRTAPRDVAQHAVFLGPRLQFDCQVDAMRIDIAWAARPWRGDALQAGFAGRALAQGADTQAARRGLIAALHDRLLPRLADAPSLEALAADFAISPATLKRRLAQHGSHYQAELDQLRAWVALYLLGPRGQGNEAVASALGFFDSANFRRFFKRWTGLLPSAVAR